MLQIGDSFPEFNSQDQDGVFVTNRDLAGYPSLILFFAYDQHAESLEIAKALMAVYADIEEFETLIIGVSPDTNESHRTMMLKHQLFFPMLTDKNQLLSRECQVLEGSKVEPALILIDEEGTIRWMEKPAKSEGLAERVLDVLEINFG